MCQSKCVTSSLSDPQDKPLLIGSIKSNLGHAEPASGVASLCKVLMSYTKGVIPPNIHLNEINPKLEAVIQGRLKIVVSILTWLCNVHNVYMYTFI